MIGPQGNQNSQINENQSGDQQPSGDQQRLEAVERKVSLLISLGIGQVVLLVVILSLMLMNQFMPKWSTLLMFVVTVGLVAYIFRGQLPGLLGRISRFIFAKLATSQKTGSSKDIH